MIRVGIFLLFLVLVSCKKEPTTWNTSSSTPILKASLGIYDLIADSLLETGTDNLVSIVYTNDIFNFGIDSLVEVEKDTIENSFSIFPIAQIDVNSGQQFYNQSDVIAFNQVNAALSRAVIAKGDLKLKATSNIEGDLLFTVVIPEARKNGNSFEYEAIIPSGSFSEPGILIESTSMDGYDLNLTGASGAEFNEIEIVYSLRVPHYEEEVTIFAANEVSMEITFDGLEVDFVEGYLGTDEFEFDEVTAFENIPELSEALINLGDAKLELTISNGFGVDLQAVIFQLEAKSSYTGNSIGLNNSLMGSNINLTRAGIDQQLIEPTEKNYIIDQNNSNIVELLEVIPDSLSITGRAVLNPFGNISNYNDFASSQSEFDCTARVEIPLRASFSNLTLRDTANFEWSGENKVLNAALYLHANSTFKANAELSIIFADKLGNQLLSMTDYLIENQLPLIAGATEISPGITTLVFELNESDMELLERADQVFTEMRFETTNYPGLVEIKSTDKIDLLISTDVNAQLELK